MQVYKAVLTKSGFYRTIVILNGLYVRKGEMGVVKSLAIRQEIP